MLESKFQGRTLEERDDLEAPNVKAPKKPQAFERVRAKSEFIHLTDSHCDNLGC